MKIRTKIVAVALSVGLMAGMSGCAWANKAGEVVGPDNVSDQYDRVITDWESLYSSTLNACGAQADLDSNSPTFVEGPELAYAATARKIVVDYNARMNNIFEAQAVAPIGYPRRIDPALMAGQGLDWCEIVNQLDALKAQAEQG